MAGTQNLKEVLKLFLNLIEDVNKSLADGNIGLTDAFNFFDTLQMLGPALSGLDQVPTELADLDEKERQELNNFIREEFDIENDKVEGYIEKALAGILLLTDLIPLFKSKAKK